MHNKLSVITCIVGVVTTLLIATGCKSIPTVDQMAKLGTASGYTAAFVLNTQVKVDDTTRNAIVDIMGRVENSIPDTNQTFVSVWTPIAQSYLDEFKDKNGNPLSDTVKKVILTNFGYVVGLLDTYVDKKGIREYKDLTETFVHSFCDSFLTNFKPVNTVSASLKKEELDEFTYSTMMKAAGLKWTYIIVNP